MVERIKFGEPIEPLVLIEEIPPLSLLSREEIRSNDPFQVYILENVYSQLWQHVRSSPMIECGGVLVGHPFKSIDTITTFVVIVSAIPQASSNRGIAHFTVSPSEVANSRDELEKNYPGLVAVGWYHSHPGHGVFLSAQDMTIVRSIYNLNWHLAIVLDPQHQEIGTFAGPDGVKVSNPIILSKEPDSVKIIAKYNQLRKIQPEDKDIHQSLLEEISSIVANSIELQHWKRQGKYRDLILLSHSPMEETNQEISLSSPILEEKRTEVLVNQNTNTLPLVLPQAARKESSNTNSIISLALIFLPVVVFSLLSIVAIIYFQLSIILIILGWGVFLSILASYAVVYLLRQGDTERTTQFRKKKEKNYKLYGTLLLISIIISWMVITIFAIILLK